MSDLPDSTTNITTKNPKDEIELVKKAIMEQLHNEYNEQLEETYLEFVDKLDEIKELHKQKMIDGLQNLPLEHTNNLVDQTSSLLTN